jgi:hypothetical protein
MLLREATSGTIVRGTKDGQALVWDATTDQWHPGDVVPGGGVAHVFGDIVDNTDPSNPVVDGVRQVVAGAGVSVTGTATAPVVSALAQQKVLVDASDTTPGYLADKLAAGGNITLSVLNVGGNEQLEIGFLAGLAITSLSTPTTLLEAGVTLATPTFTVAYNELPDSSTLTDNQGNPPQALSTPFTSIVSADSYTKSTYATVTATITATKTGAGTAVRSVNMNWGFRNYYGVAAPGGSTEAFILALSSDPLSTSRTVPNFTEDVTVGNELYYASPTSQGTPLLFDVSTGFQIDMTVVSTTIAVTNAHGVTVNYTLQRSTNSGLGSLTVRVQ